MNLKQLNLFVLLLVTGIAYSQNISQSPYSRFGLGELQSQCFAAQNAMGQVGQGLRTSAGVNILNPASYSAFMYTSYEAGLLVNSTTQSNAVFSQKVNNASMAYISLGVPISIKRKIGAVMGLMPYSSGSYSLDDTVQKLNNSVSVRDYVKGESNFNRAFLGIGKEFFNKISVGVNFNYIWGSYNNTVASFYPQDSGYFSPAVINSASVGSFMLDAGLQFRHSFTTRKISANDTTYKRYYFVLGTSGNGLSKLQGTQSYLYGNTVFTGNPSQIGFWDTISYTNNQKGYITIPIQYKLGMSFGRTEKWNLYIDYEKSTWKNFENFGRKEPLADRSKIAIGYSWMPDRMANLKKHYLKRIEYRVGARQEKLYYSVNNKQIEELAFSGGVSLPVLIPKGSAMPNESARLHISFDYTQRGTTSDKLVMENIWHLYFGITFTDKWFTQRKIY